jgi:mannose-6-phosphate isomerase-like protein (cupin superfamily)
MEILHSDSVFKVADGTSPSYSKGNSLEKVMRLVEQAQLACDREWYLRDHMQYLFPFETLELYGPQGQDADILDATLQDNKTDFQKQNIKTFQTSTTSLIRGWVTTGDWTGPFLRLSYQGAGDSPLAKALGTPLGPGPDIKLWIKVGKKSVDAPLTVPYNERSGRYEIELWGYAGADLRTRLGGTSLDSLNRGELQVRNDLVNGSPADFQREKLNDRDMREVADDCIMHPILPLHIECAWADRDLKVWDSNGGTNYHYEFSMILRGWDNFLGTGVSGSPHGGVGFLEYRNLLSNYGRFKGSGELDRELPPWSFNAFGEKNAPRAVEPFMAVDYMDLHILKPECGIGLHRHRDNQEVFLMLEGRGFMVVGDWCKMPQRERALEVRTLRAGHFAMLKGGNLHALMNATDENIALFMFGGYD